MTKKINPGPPNPEVLYSLVETLTHRDFRATWRAADTGAPMCRSFRAPVLFSGRAVSPGRGFRGAGDAVPHGPFPCRQEAVEYALRTLANPAGARVFASLGRGRRAARPSVLAAPRLPC